MQNNVAFSLKIDLSRFEFTPLVILDRKMNNLYYFVFVKEFATCVGLYYIEKC